LTNTDGIDRRQPITNIFAIDDYVGNPYSCSGVAAIGEGRGRTPRAVLVDGRHFDDK